ncbi:unnamed protein product, partial [Schistosoma mattheei]
FALTFENTAVLCDLILRFPDVYHSHYDGINEISILLKWSFNLLRESQLMSKSDENILHLTEQELNFVIRDSNYVNEFSSDQVNLLKKIISLGVVVIVKFFIEIMNRLMIPRAGSWMRTAEESYNRTKRSSSASRFSIVV